MITKTDDNVVSSNRIRFRVELKVRLEFGEGLKLATSIYTREHLPNLSPVCILKALLPLSAPTTSIRLLLRASKSAAMPCHTKYVLSLSLFEVVDRRSASSATMSKSKKMLAFAFSSKETQHTMTCMQNGDTKLKSSKNLPHVPETLELVSLIDFVPEPLRLREVNMMEDIRSFALSEAYKKAKLASAVEGVDAIGFRVELQVVTHLFELADACDLCLVDFMEKEKVAYMSLLGHKCKHMYHLECLRSFWLRGIECPNCHGNVTEPLRWLTGDDTEEFEFLGFGSMSGEEEEEEEEEGEEGWIVSELAN